jgi:hypothetical protein
VVVPYLVESYRIVQCQAESKVLDGGTARFEMTEVILDASSRPRLAIT